MCDTCGCGDSNNITIHPRHNYNHDHNDNHDHDHPHEHSGNHDHTHTHSVGGVPYTHSHAHGHESIKSREIQLNVDVLSDNNSLAGKNRNHFKQNQILALNLVSSPGSGKTTILEKTIQALIGKHKIYVIEGDQQTLLDADRIEKSGAPAVQINTGAGCHLDAKMIDGALKNLTPEPNSILFIENVGNLVCPALFDLGEMKRVVVISVTEGEDKPLKYPYMFQTSHLCIINKSDLLPYVDFRVDEAIRYARSLNPELEFLVVSARSGAGMQEWFNWLEKLLNSN